ncbi:hypothetical protein CR513_46987, partial [Mucuna pruriens]
MFESKIRKEKKSRNSLESIPRTNLEGRLGQLHRQEDHVDLAAVDAFLVMRNKGENPMIAILANTFYSLNYCYERNGKALRCCTTLLYLWLAAHLFHSKGRTTCPIEDYHWSWVKTMSKAKWTKHLDEATKKSIRWYPQ